MDEHVKHQDACNREDLVNQFKDRLVEGSAVTLKRYSLREIQPNYRMVNTNLRLSFLSNTKVEPCTDFNGSLYGFDFRGYKSISDLKQEEDGQFDVIGHVVACEDLDNYDKNEKSGKKKPLTWWMMWATNSNVHCEALLHNSLIHLECVLGSRKDHFSASTSNDKIWDGNMRVQNEYNATKLFLFDATQPIVKEEFQAVKEYSLRLFAREDVEKYENTASRISTASRNSTKESSVTKFPLRNNAELLGGVPSIIKAIRSQDMIDLEADMPNKSAAAKDDWFQLQIRVQDEIGTMSLTLWNDETNTTSKKLLPVFTVLRLSDDPEILDSIHISATPSKMDSEATSSALPSITPLDLESQTDENTTPVNTKKNNAMDYVDKESSDGKNKRPAKNDISTESSNGKKMAIKLKTEKDA
ncbi:replication protein A 70 kDa DNA-binding subunit B [Tanacetum coccineum]